MFCNKCGSKLKEGAAFCSVCAVLIYIFAAPLATYLSGGDASPAEASLKLIAPALFTMGIISSKRGYFQGRNNMFPSAVSQVFESFFKALIGILLCALFIGGGIAKGAAGAVFGVTLGAVCSALVLSYFYKKQNLPKGRFSFNKAMTVIRFSIPITLGAFGFTAVLFTDALTVTSILADCGFDTSQRLKLFGFLSRANTVYNLPATIITSITASIVPLISATKSDDKTTLSDNTFRAIKLLFLVAMPCAAGLTLFAPQIFMLLFKSDMYSSLLACIGLLVLIMPYFQTTTAMLQALGKVWSPIVFCILSILLKNVLNYVFIPKIGIIGAPLATAAAFSVAFLYNTIMLHKTVNIKPLVKFIPKLIICTILSCGSARLIYVALPSTLTLGISILFAAVLYVILIIKSKCLTPDELRLNSK